jgi:hypothetical protein
MLCNFGIHLYMPFFQVRCLYPLDCKSIELPFLRSRINSSKVPCYKYTKSAQGAYSFPFRSMLTIKYNPQRRVDALTVSVKQSKKRKVVENKVNPSFLYSFEFCQCFMCRLCDWPVVFCSP